MSVFKNLPYLKLRRFLSQIFEEPGRRLIQCMTAAFCPAWLRMLRPLVGRWLTE